MTRRSSGGGAPAAVRLGGTPAAGTKQKQRRMPSPCASDSSGYSPSAVAAPVAPVERYRDTAATGVASRTGADTRRGAEAGGEGAPLGRVTRNSSQIVGEVSVDPETGEILGQRDSQTIRAERWALKSAADSIRPNTRTCTCCKHRAPNIGAPGLQDVQIIKSAQHGKAHYKGLMVCGSVWHCPLCAAIVANHRRAELIKAIDKARAMGWGIHFVTLTVPHGVGDDLAELLDKLSKALKLMSSGNRSGLKYQLSRIHESAKVLGFIRALEVTHGQNGWHPHYHLIVFTPPSIGSSIVQHAYATAWASACVRSGLPQPLPGVGVRVKDGNHAGSYVSKWGIEDEMTKSQAKTGKTKGLSPWGLLRVYLGEDHPDYTQERAAALFRVYADAFKGRRQLHWSCGLRDLLQLGTEASDQELAEREQDRTGYSMAWLTFQQWKAITRKRLQAATLNAAESGPDALSAFVQLVTGSPPEMPQPLKLAG